MALCHIKKLFIFFEMQSEGYVGEIIQCLNLLWSTSGKKTQEKTKGEEERGGDRRRSGTTTTAAAATPATAAAAKILVVVESK